VTRADFAEGRMVSDGDGVSVARAAKRTPMGHGGGLPDASGEDASTHSRLGLSWLHVLIGAVSAVPSE